MKPYEMNVLTLAYIGDSVYEVYIRRYLIEKNIVKVKELQNAAISFVSAKGQAQILKKWLDAKLLTEKELEIIYRARNHKGNRHPKNTDIITYKYATALEALIGYWYLDQKFDRLEEFMNRTLGETICMYMEKM